MRKMNKFVLLLIFIFANSAFSARRLKINPQLQNEFEATRTQISQGEVPKFANLANYKILFVRGIYTDLYGNLSKWAFKSGLPIPEGMVDPLYHEQKWFTENGYDSHFAPIHTEGSAEDNGKIIADEILKSDKPVVVVSHSKGGADVLFSLVQNPETQKKVVGWLNLQAPIYGTQLSDFLTGRAPFNTALFFLHKLVGANHNALKGMSTTRMLKFHKENGDKVKELLKNVPTLSVAGKFSVPSLWKIPLWSVAERSGLEATNRIIRYFGGGDNDGLTPTYSSCFANIGHECLILERFDHSGPVTNLYPFFGYSTEERRTFMLSFLAMMEKRIVEK